MPNCTRCSGTGMIPTDVPREIAGWKTCPDCAGLGRIGTDVGGPATASGNGSSAITTKITLHRFAFNIAIILSGALFYFSNDWRPSMIAVSIVFIGFGFLITLFTDRRFNNLPAQLIIFGGLYFVFDYISNAYGTDQANAIFVWVGGFFFVFASIAFVWSLITRFPLLSILAMAALGVAFQDQIRPMLDTLSTG